MTRLTHTDICGISQGLIQYDRVLKRSTGKSMLGIAAHAYGEDEATIAAALKDLEVRVIPVTAGQGIITDFSRTVARILAHLGCRAEVTAQCDASGLARAFEEKADAVMLADDFRFVGINLHTRKVADNTPATGRVFAAALELMAGGLEGKKVLVLGCGPVGEAGARALARAGGIPVLYDIDPDRARALEKRLTREDPSFRMETADRFPETLAPCPYIFEATPGADSIPDDLILNERVQDDIVRDDIRIAAPGVPLGLSHAAARRLGHRLIHDKLELGVAAMAADLVRNPAP